MNRKPIGEFSTFPSSDSTTAFACCYLLPTYLILLTLHTCRIPPPSLPSQVPLVPPLFLVPATLLLPLFPAYLCFVGVLPLFVRAQHLLLFCRLSPLTCLPHPGPTSIHALPLPRLPFIFYPQVPCTCPCYAWVGWRREEKRRMGTTSLEEVMSRPVGGNGDSARLGLLHPHVCYGTLYPFSSPCPTVAPVPGLLPDSLPVGLSLPSHMVPAYLPCPAIGTPQPPTPFPGFSALPLCSVSA